MDIFLRINDLSLDLGDEAAYALVIDTATGVMDKEAIADLLEKRTHKQE